MIVNIGKLTYLLDDTKFSATVTKALVPYSGDIEIPATVEHSGKVYAVTDILDEAFKECTELRSVVLGENVDSIGIGSFEGCTMLSKVVFNEALHLIGMQAFKGCESLVALVLPPKVLVIGRAAFMGCTSLESVYLPDNLINIEP